MSIIYAASEQNNKAQPNNTNKMTFILFLPPRVCFELRVIELPLPVHALLHALGNHGVARV